MCPCASIEVPYSAFIDPASVSHDQEVCGNKTTGFIPTEFGWVRSDMNTEHFSFHDVLEYSGRCTQKCKCVRVSICRMAYCLNIMQAFTELHNNGSMASPILLSATVAFNTMRTALRGEATAHRMITSHSRVLLYRLVAPVSCYVPPSMLAAGISQSNCLVGGLSEAYPVSFDPAGISISMLSGSRATRDMMLFSGLLDQGGNASATSAVVVSPSRRLLQMHVSV